MSAIVNIEKIEEGMILSEPIINGFGQTLLPAGASISGKHLRLLKTWNIRVIHAMSKEGEIDNEISEELQQLANDKLTSRMKWFPRNSIEKDLFKVGIIQTIRAMSLAKRM